MELFSRQNRLPTILGGAVLAVSLAVPLFLPSPTYLQILIILYWYAYLATSWNLVGGFAGVLPLGHAAFAGIGAYTSSVLYLYYGISPWLGMLVGGVIAAGFGVLLGLPTFKLRGAYFALATIACGEGLRVMAENINAIGPLKINGPRGILIPLVQSSFTAYQFSSKAAYYYIILIMLILVLAFTWAISRSKLGYYLYSGGEEPEAAQSLGVNVARCKLIAMAMSAFLTALGGTFYAQLALYFYPKGILGLDLSEEVAMIALVGGRGTILGPILGAFLMRPVSEFTRIYLSSSLPGFHLIVYGLILIIVMIYEPRGLQEPLTKLAKWAISRFSHSAK